MQMWHSVFLVQRSFFFLLCWENQLWCNFFSRGFFIRYMFLRISCVWCHVWFCEFAKLSIFLCCGVFFLCFVSHAAFATLSYFFFCGWRIRMSIRMLISISISHKCSVRFTSADYLIIVYGRTFFLVTFFFNSDELSNQIKPIG